MTSALNEILHYLKSNEKETANKRTKLALRLHLIIPSSQLEVYIQKLYEDGQIHISYHDMEIKKEASVIAKDKNISFILSSRGKQFLKEGGYQLQTSKTAFQMQLRA